MTLTVDEILAAPRADRMRLIRENVDNLSGEDINKITTSLLHDIKANLKKSASDISLSDLPARPLFRTKPVATESTSQASPDSPDKEPISTTSEQAPKAPPQEEIPEKPEEIISPLVKAAEPSTEAEPLSKPEEKPDFSAWLEPQPEVPLLPAPSEEDIPEDSLEDDEGYETAALMMPETLPEAEADQVEAGESVEEDPEPEAGFEVEAETESLDVLEVPTDTGILIALPTAQAVAELQRAQAEEDARQESLETDDEPFVAELSQADTPVEDDSATDVEDGAISDLDLDIPLHVEEIKEDPDPVFSKKADPLLLGADALIPSPPEAASADPEERSTKPQEAFADLEDPFVVEGDAEARSERLRKLWKGALALLPTPCALAAAYFGTDLAADLIGADPYFDLVIGVVILLNVCWMICELTGVAFRGNMVVAVRLAFIMSLYYPLEILSRYIGGGSVGMDSLIYLILPISIGVSDLWVSRKK